MATDKSRVSTYIGIAVSVLTIAGLTIAGVLYITQPVFGHEIRIDNLEHCTQKNQENIEEIKVNYYQIDKKLDVLIERTKK